MEKYKSTSLWLFIPITACLLAVLPLSSTGYLAVRLVVSFAALYIVFGWKEQVRIELKLIFTLVGVLFNPIFPVFLHSKVAWVVIDILVAALFFSQLREKEIEPSKAMSLQSLCPPSNSGSSPQTIAQSAHFKPTKDWYDNVVKPLRLAVISIDGLEYKIADNPQLENWFLGYCCGFIMHAKSPDVAFSLEENGMWVKQSHYGTLDSGVPWLLDEIVGAEFKSKLLNNFSVSILFDSEWEDGYGYGIRDAEFWLESGAITQALKRRVTVI